MEIWNRFRDIPRYFRTAPDHLKGNELRSHDRYRMIAFAGAAATLSNVVIAIVGIATIPMVIYHIGKEQFGLWMIVSSLVIWMQLADFGISNGLSNALAEAFGRDDPEASSKYMSSALAVTLMIALVSLPVLALAYYGVQWGRLLKIENVELVFLARNTLLVVGLAFIVNIPIALVNRAFIAYQRGYVVSITKALASVCTLAGLWLVVRAEMGLIWIVGVSAFTPVLFNLFLWFKLPGLESQMRLSYSRVRRSAISRVAASSVPLFIFQVGALLLGQLVNLMIARTASISLVADYNVILRIYLFVFTVAAAVGAPFYAAIREAYERGDGNWVNKAVKNSLSVRLVATIPFVLVLLVFGDQLVRWWIGDTMAEPIGVTGWIFVSLSLLLAATSSLFSEILSALDDIWAQIGVVFLSAATVLTLLVYLIPEFGVSGVFLAMAASTLFSIAWGARRLKRNFLSS